MWPIQQSYQHSCQVVAIYLLKPVFSRTLQFDLVTWIHHIRRLTLLSNLLRFSLLLATTSGVNFRPVCSPKYKVIVKVFLLVFRWTLYWLPWSLVAIPFRWFVLNHLLQRNMLVALEKRSQKRHALQRTQGCASVCSVNVSLCWWDPFSRCFC